MKTGLSCYILTARTKAPARGPTGNKDKGLKALPGRVQHSGRQRTGVGGVRFRPSDNDRPWEEGFWGWFPSPTLTKAPAHARSLQKS